MAKQKWSRGDLFAIPLADGTVGFAQAMSIEPKAMNSVVAGMYDLRARADETRSPEEFADERLIAVLFITRDLLDSGQWPVIAHRDPSDVERFVPLQTLRASGFTGAKVIGSANIVRLLNGYFRLAPWNLMKDPEYFDRLLLPGRARPSDVLLQ